ncbi:nipped-B-like protein B, partial [Asbolus verrucosus]
ARAKDRPSDDKSRKDKRDSRDRDRERERERERRIAREEREAAREKEREEALARCQERQRERERLKELAKKEEERTRGRDRSRREDRGLDKPSSDRVERLLPLPEDRIPPGRKHSSDRERGDRRERDRRERTPERRKSVERRDIDKDRGYDRNYDRSGDRNYERESRDHDRDRDRDYAAAIPSRMRDAERRMEDKEYDSPYDRARHEDRRYLDIDDHYNENSRDERLALEGRDYGDERRSRRDLWDARDERDLDLEHRRYREDSRPPASLKGRDWDADYPEHDWDRARRPIDWEGRENWDSSDHKHLTEEDWRLYNWSNEERRRWAADWRERSRPRSSTSHNRDDETMSESRRKEPPPRQDPRSDRSDSKTSMPEIEVKKEAPLKRVAEEPLESPVEAKKPCVIEPVLEDDLSEISDDADDILNRDEVSSFKAKGDDASEIIEPQPEEAIAPEQTETSSIKDQPNSSASQKSQSPSRSPNRIQKDESIDEENMDLDFEEISEDELEEESRVRGIGDALGVDWASLVAESRPKVKPMSSAKRRWESHNVLVNLGISVELAGEDLVKEILQEHSEAEIKEQNEEKRQENEAENINGIKEENKTKVAVSISHPIGVIQVANRERQATRKALFSSVGPNCRALSARRDLMIRRHLCNLPLKDSYVEAPKRYDPELLKLAVQMFERCL